jgi:dihydrofolate reductase
MIRIRQFTPPLRYRPGMTISIIVAAALNNVIGKTGGIPWYLPADQARFREITTGHPIIMGRRTHESIGRPLPGRTNIIVTHDINYRADGCIVTASLEEALKEARKQKSDEIFIIGGGIIYEQAMAATDKIYMTRVIAEIEGDIIFNFDEKTWKKIFSEKHSKDERNEYDYEYLTYVRRAKH